MEDSDFCFSVNKVNLIVNESNLLMNGYSLLRNQFWIHEVVKLNEKAIND